MLDTVRQQQLLTQGFCHFPNVLDRQILDDLIRVTDGLLDAEPAERHHKFRYQGSNINVAYQDPVFARLFAWPKTMEALASLGYRDPKWWSGYLLSKPPLGPPLYWHQDWWAWDHPRSADPHLLQAFLMYYLTDTTRENGCLRVIPGSHARRVDLHELLPPAHSEETYEAPLDSPIFSHHTQEIDVPVKAGDLVVGDARLLHAAHANQTNQRRSLLTLWYFPDYESLPEVLRAFIARKKPLDPPDWWEGEAGKVVEPLIPYYTGDAEPAKWNRVPGELLKY